MKLKKQCQLYSLAAAKKKAADPHQGAAFFQGYAVIAAHAHGEYLQLAVGKREWRIVVEEVFQGFKFIAYHFRILRKRSHAHESPDPDVLKVA